LIISANESHFCDCCRNAAGHFICALETAIKAFSERPFAVHCQQPEHDKENVNSTTYGAPFVKISYLTDLAQKLLSLRIYNYLCADLIISGIDSYLCMQRCYICQR